ncbi:hypothetical protein ACLOJK_001051 [Asimina triloba]
MAPPHLHWGTTTQLHMSQRRRPPLLRRRRTGLATITIASCTLLHLPQRPSSMPAGSIQPASHARTQLPHTISHDPTSRTVQSRQLHAIRLLAPASATSSTHPAAHVQ